jgi:gliding motility-associated-like protein
VESDLGCIKTSSGTYYPVGNLYLPNAFTPDMDGTNDFWKAEGHDIAWFEIIVFNRWGDVVYQSKDINDVWDGSHKSGDYFIQDGVYLYQMKAQGVRGNIIEQQGTITILR